jgi:hypothetical protein
LDRHGDSKKELCSVEPASKFQHYAFRPLVSDPKGVERIGEWWGRWWRTVYKTPKK